MTSTTQYAWREAGLRFYKQSFHYRTLFGQRAQRISLDGGFTCPNVDGSITTGGCTFCDNRSFSPSRRSKRIPIEEQLAKGMRGVKRRYGDTKYLAYFQPATNTYGKLEKLQHLYELPLAFPDVVGLIIGTRPDCVPNPVLDYVESLTARTYVSMEYGIQTIHNASLDWMNRGHHYDCFPDAMHRSRDRGFEISAHLILGLPGETPQMMLQTIDEVCSQGVDAIKLHNLYAVEKTKLADQVRAGEVTLMERDEYVEIVCDCLERVPGNVVIERLTGEAPPDYLVAPDWCLQKTSLQQQIEKELERRDSYQGLRA